MGDRLAEAEGLLKQATKLTTPGLLRWSLDWEQATPLLERAGQLFKVGRAAARRSPLQLHHDRRNQPRLPPRRRLQQAGDNRRAKECYERAAVGQERQKSGWHAAKDLEKAGELAGQVRGMTSCRRWWAGRPSLRASHRRRSPPVAAGDVGGA